MNKEQQEKLFKALTMYFSHKVFGLLGEEDYCFLIGFSKEEFGGGIDVLLSYQIDDQNTDDWHSIDVFKPILRPLSDLTKEIEINGKVFVPSNYGYWEGDWKKNGTVDDISTSTFSVGGNLEKIQQLLEWHFDIFGLIDDGLAVDINTIES